MRGLAVMSVVILFCTPTAAEQSQRQKKCQMADLTIGILAPSQLSAISKMKSLDIEALLPDDPSGKEREQVDKILRSRENTTKYWKELYDGFIEYSSLMRDCQK